MNMRKFGQKMRKTAEQVQENANRTVRRVALAVDATVVMSTPVDTGRARSNWQVEVAGMPDSAIPAYSEGKGGSTAGENTRAALEQANVAVAAYAGEGSIHITNNLPYIGRLNDGSSAQAPSGFVQLAVQRGVEAIRGARIVP